MATLSSYSGDRSPTSSTRGRPKGWGRGSTTTCSICLRILRVWQNVEPDRGGRDLRTIEEYLGKIDDVIQHSRCQAHRELICGSFSLCARALQILLRVTGYPSPYSLQVQRVRGYRSLYFKISTGHEHEFSSRLSLVRSVDDPRKALGSTTLDPLWIDSQLPKDWMRACERCHGPRCSQYWDSAEMLRNRPNLLIDIKDQCIVKTGLTIIPYVALSYVWEQGDSFKTSCSNLSRLQERGALGSITGRIAKTIQSAMHVVELLGMRYLWADALCIVQDDAIFKHVEIQRMHAIYANASLTIIAASSAPCGITGLRGFTEQRHLRQVVHQFGKRQVVEISSGLDVPGSQSEPSRWASRGWTFQENMFSPRKLIFTRDSIRWECEKATWLEDQATWHEKISTEHQARWQLPKMLLLKIPDVRGLVTLLNDYATRSFTFEEDALFACAGVFSPLQTSYHGGFISGLPRAFFNSALLWVHDGPATRRRARFEHQSKVCLPSWSWAGWKGQFSLRSWEIGTDHLKGTRNGGLKSWEVGNEHSKSSRSVRKAPSRTYLFRSRIQWYSHESANAEPQEIACSWLQSRDDHPWSTNTPLPAGWKRVEGMPNCQWWQYRGPQRGLDREIPKWCFTHESEPTTEFWYPLQIGEDGESCSEAGNLSPFISCRTRRGYANCGPLEQCRIQNGRFGTSRHIDVQFFSLVNEDGEWIGALEVHDDLALGDPSDPNSHCLTGNRLELVELGEGGCEEGPFLEYPAVPEFQLRARPKMEDEFYQFYFVLWIEWTSNIAYRRGLGRVMKAAWEAQALDDIDLMLG